MRNFTRSTKMEDIGAGEVTTDFKHLWGADFKSVFFVFRNCYFFQYIAPNQFYCVILIKSVNNETASKLKSNNFRFLDISMVIKPLSSYTCRNVKTKFHFLGFIMNVYLYTYKFQFTNSLCKWMYVLNVSLLATVF